ncbi:MAG: 3'-5' exonuclease [Bacteroidota bacterium]|nr:3'-5' exonuclease [Bacteroidota bacterium]
MKNTFTAIDFETAHGKRWSICQVGLVRVENGIITDKLSILVQPPDNFYFYRNTEIHGITPQQTRHSPTFDGVWGQLEPYIKEQDVIAHNGFAFDFNCLEHTLAYYDIAKPQYKGYCTYKIYKANLASLCKQYNIPLNHHDALSDAMACARLYEMHIAATNYK